MRHLAVLGLGVVALAAVAGAHRSQAADLAPNYPMPPVYQEPDAQFEFGTGWYLRGDASGGFENHPKLTAYGALDTRAQDWGYGVGGGIGFKFNNYFRADVTGDYLQPFDYSHSYAGDGTTTNLSASLNRYDGMVNGYFDLGTWWGVTPYIGAGVGFSVFDPSATLTTADAFGNRSIANYKIGDTTQFAWAAMAGLSYQLDQSVVIDLGYRHLDLGRFGVTVAGNSYAKDFTRDEVRLGVRYMIN